MALRAVIGERCEGITEVEGRDKERAVAREVRGGRRTRS